MSRMRVTRPSSVLTTTSSNSRASRSRPSVSTLSWKAPCSGTGGWLSTPEATWTFWPRNASTTSPAVKLRAATLSGSSQIRIA